MPAADIADKPARTTPSSVAAALGSGLLIALVVALGLIGTLVLVVPNIVGGRALTVTSSSMDPTYPAGTVVVIRPVRPDDVVPGTVITYQLPDTRALVTHRVTQSMLLADGERVFQTKGDANRAPDPDLVKAGSVRGEVWYAIPMVGWLTFWIPPQGRALLIAAAVAGLTIYAMWMFVSAFRDRSRLRTTHEGERDRATEEAGSGELSLREEECGRST